MRDSRAARLVRKVEGVAYWAATAPVLARMPAVLGYRMACWRGDWLYRQQPPKRADLECNLRRVLGGELSRTAVRQATRDWFRFASCEALDVMRLRHRARPLRRLVTIRGREHLEGALAAGKGAILCCGHFGSYDSSFSVLHTSGFPVTSIGRWQHKYTAGLSRAERQFWDWALARRVRRHRQRPNIEPWPGRFEVATLAASALRANEVVTICIDAPPLDSDKARAVSVPFLGQQARLVPGVVTLAQVTGAPVLPCFLYRSADYRHQVLEISAPVPVEGDTATAFARCAAEVSAAIRRSPASWVYWPSPVDLASLGMIPPERDASPAPELVAHAGLGLVTPREIAHGGRGAGASAGHGPGPRTR
jgi:phosphatidylinositol dimannoside acyltransferase